jgi:OOP family OmpA-OmpF porin
VTDALLVSVRQNPRVLVDALFPIILPAIRRAVAGMLRGLVQSLNQVVEQSLTVRGLRWRWEAWRTGRPVGEIALRDSLVYRVEQALLIHAENGILLQSAGGETALDADLMSALLTAIRDFGRESFGEGGEGDFPELPAGGGRQVLVEQGPHAVLAVIVRGTPAAKLREAMQDSLGEIQRWYARQLIGFNGDTSAFEGCKTYLEQCLESEYRREKQSLTPAFLFLSAAAAVAIAVAVWTLWPRWKWDKYLDRLRAEPGIAVIDEGRSRGKFRAEILRDPLAADPEIYLYEAGFGTQDAELRIEPIVSFHPAMIVRRAEAVLKPPDNVRLDAANGVLSAAGSAPGAWIADFRARAASIPGVDRFDDGGLTDETARSLGELKRGIETPEIGFQVAEENFAGQSQVIENWARDLKSIAALLAAAGPESARRAAIRVIGQTDETGSERANLELSRRRARRVARTLQSNGIDTAGYEVVGIGENPIEGEISPQSLRRVVIRVDFDGNSGTIPNK